MAVTALQGTTLKIFTHGRAKRLIRHMSVLVLSAALTACAGPRMAMTGEPDSQVVSRPGGETSAKAARAGAAYQRNPRNAKAAYEYAKALRELGRAHEAVSILDDATRLHPDDKDLLAEYAKSLTAAGQASESLGVFAAARQVNPDDWSLLSAEGIALDQIGRHREARTLYEKALKLNPDHPDILTNLALSHALSGNLSASESLLRRAARNPDAGSQVRQNLALVLALRGRFDEAEHIMAELDPDTAEDNLAAMREMFQQPALWASATETAPVPEVAQMDLNAEMDKTAARLPQGETAALHPPTHRAATPPARAETAGASAIPAVAPAKTEQTRSAPAAQSTPTRRPATVEPIGNGPDLTFFAFEY